MKKFIMFVVLLFVFMCPIEVEGISSYFSEQKENSKINIISPFNKVNKVNGDDSDIQKIFEVPKNVILDMIDTTDGNLLISGTSYYIADGDFSKFLNPYMAKIDNSGNLIWEFVNENRTWTSTNTNIETSNGDYVGVGSYSDPASAYIVSVSKNGEFLWDQTLKIDDGNYYMHTSYSDVLEIDSNYVAVGGARRTVYSPTYKQICNGIMITYSKDGTKIKEKLFDPSVFSNIIRFINLKDGYILFGNYQQESGMTIPCIRKYNNKDEIVWEKTFEQYSQTSFDVVNIDDNVIHTLINIDNGSLTESYINKLKLEDGSLIESINADDLSGVSVNKALYSNHGYYLISGIDANSNSTMLVVDKDGKVVKRQTVQTEDLRYLLYYDDYKYYFSEMVVLRNSEEQNIGYDTNLYTFPFKYNIKKNDTLHGTYEIEQKKNKGIITVNPDKGFKCFKVFVEDSTGVKIDVVEKDGKYYFDLKDDLQVTVFFDKINDNDGYTLFKKDWDYKKDCFPEDEFDMLIYFSGYDNYVNNNYVAYKNNLKNNVVVGNLSVLNKNGLLLKEKEFDNFMIYDIDILNDNIYVLGFENFDEENQKAILKRFDKQLTMLKEIEIVNFPNSFGMLFELSVLCSLDLFKVYNNEIYVPVNSGYAIYDEKLESSRINSNFEEICDFSEQYCLIMNDSSNDDEQILGFAKNDNYKVLSGSKDVNDKNVSFVKLLNLKEEVIFYKTIEKYEDISTVLFFKNYIVGIGIIGDIDFTEIFVMDLEGNIVQTINDSVLFTRLKIVDNGFLTLVIDFEEDSTCDLGDSDFCVSTSRRLYTYSLDIKATTNEKGTIEIVNNAKPGETVEVKVTPKIGYKFEGLRITDASGNVTVVNGTSFVMPDSAVSVEPIFSLVISNVVQEIVNPDTGSFISLLALWIFALTSVAIYKYVKKKQPILKI